MGFVIWYALEVLAPGPAPLPLVSVSNDVFGGEYVLDADIDVPMHEGEGSAIFSARIKDLPGTVVDTLRSVQQKAGAVDPMQVSVRLGYFDDAQRATKGAVLEGAVTAVRTSVTAEGAVVTELQGRDLAAWKLMGVGNIAFSPGGRSLWAAYVNHVLSAAGGVSQRGAVIGIAPKDYPLLATNGLTALGKIARLANLRFAVGDGAVNWQTFGAVAPGPELDSETNIVQLDDALSQALAERTGAEGQNAARQADAQTGFAVSVLGDPALRAGQTVPVILEGAAPRLLHEMEATHRFSTTSGYTCDLVLGKNGSGAQPPPARGAQRVAHRIVDLFEERQGEHTGIDVGTVSAYEPGNGSGHVATVNVGQSPDPGSVAPSVASPVAEDVQLHDRPIASPFAWHKCGLIVPAYPGQRALLAHHRGSSHDAVLCGYLWSDDPAMDRPRNEPGDWWLCLPTEVAGGQPEGKGVNDLTDAKGVRVIQARGLRLSVGADTLPDVGERPEVPGDLADSMVIEAQNGTRVKISPDGSVEIATDAKTVSLSNGTSSIKLDGSKAVLSTGTASLTLDGPTAKLSNGAVSVSLEGSQVAIA